MNGNLELRRIAELENEEAASRQSIVASIVGGLILAVVIFLAFWM